MSSSTTLPHGHPLTVAGVVGSLSLAIGLVVRLSGVMQGVEAGLHAKYRAAGFGVAESAAQPWWAILVLLVLVYGLALLILHVPGVSRRVLLAVTLLVLVAAASPVLALWGLFWSPFVAVVGGAWSAFCATLWAHHHPMPCERVELPGEGKVISIAEEQEKRRSG